MKKSIIFFTVVLLAVLSLGGCKSSRNLTPAQKLEREQQKRLRQIEDSLRIVDAGLALDSMDFVLEADKLLLKYGGSVQVQSVTNFISVSKGKATVQIAPFIGAGPNGVGGFTLDGNVTNVKHSIDKHGTRTVQMTVQGVALSSIITVTLYANSVNAQADINPNFNSLRCSLQGIIKPYAQNSTFKGSTL